MSWVVEKTTLKYYISTILFVWSVVISCISRSFMPIVIYFWFTITLVPTNLIYKEPDAACCILTKRIFNCDKESLL